MSFHTDSDGRGSVSASQNRAVSKIRPPHGARWKNANGFGAGEPPTAGGKVFALSFALSLVMAVNLALFLNDPKTTQGWGVAAGFVAGFGWVAMGLAIVSLFARRSWAYVRINGGYLTVALVLMGAILGGWR